MAAKIVATLLEAGVEVGELGQVETLFDFIAPLTADLDGADAGQDEEVRRPQPGFFQPCIYPNRTVYGQSKREAAHRAWKDLQQQCLVPCSVARRTRPGARPVGSEWSLRLRVACAAGSRARPRPSWRPMPRAPRQDFEEEQGAVARLIHRLRSPRPARHFAVLKAARARLGAGGARRLRFVLPPIAFAALGLVAQLSGRGGAGAGPSGGGAGDDGEDALTAEAVRARAGLTSSLAVKGQAR